MSKQIGLLVVPCLLFAGMSIAGSVYATAQGGTTPPPKVLIIRMSRSSRDRAARPTRSWKAPLYGHLPTRSGRSTISVWNPCRASRGLYFLPATTRMKHGRRTTMRLGRIPRCLRP